MDGTYEALKILQKIAKGEHCTVKYELTSHINGTVTQRCGLYLSPGFTVIEDSWIEAFAALEKQMIEKSIIHHIKGPSNKIENLKIVSSRLNRALDVIEGKDG